MLERWWSCDVLSDQQHNDHYVTHQVTYIVQPPASNLGQGIVLSRAVRSVAAPGDYTVGVRKSGVWLHLMYRPFAS